MEKSIRVRIMGKEYALRVREEDEALTREIAAFVDSKMQAFRSSHPDHPELTSAVIAALAITEEFYAFKQEHRTLLESLDEELDRLADILDVDSEPHHAEYTDLSSDSSDDDEESPD